MKIEIANQIETEKIARLIAGCITVRDVIALYGDLGVGKSVFCRSFIRALTRPDEEVPSPTFTLVQIYDTDEAELYHFDMYRLDQPADCLELGIEEAFSDAISLIEWPTKMGNYLPWDCLKITLEHGQNGENSRTMTLSSDGQWLNRLEGLKSL